MSFCAICTDDIAGIPRMEPLGRNNALVAVCDDCASEPAREKRGPECAYDPGESASQRRMYEAATAALRGFNAPQDAITERNYAAGRNLNDRTPGWILVRVPVRANGRPRDRDEVIASLSGEPWFGELRILGNTRQEFLFERPNPAVAAEQRRRSENPLAAIERYEVRR